MDGLRDSDRRLGEARRDQLQLAVEERDVAGRPDGLHRGLHHLVDLDRALLHLERPVLERPERRLEAELEQHGVAVELDHVRVVLGVEQRYPLDPAVPAHLADLVGHPHVDPAVGCGLHHVVDRHLVRAEGRAAMDERDLGRGAQQVQHPVARGVAATDDHHPLAGELGLLADQVVRALALPRRHVVARQLLRLEGAVPASDDDRPGEEVAAVGDRADDPAVGILGVGLVLDSLGGRLEMDRHVELLEALLAQLVHQVLGDDPREAGNVVDPLLRVERRELAAELRQRVDDPRAGLAHPGPERRDQADRSGADHRDVADLAVALEGSSGAVLGHVTRGSRGRRRARRRAHRARAPRTRRCT